MKIIIMPLGQLQTNCYIGINQSTKECFVVDPGDCSEKVINYLVQEKLDLKAILLTHGHFDHIGAVADLKSKYPLANIYMHKDEIGKISNTQLSRRLSMQVNIKHFDVDVEVCDGEVYDIIGYKIKAMLTSGHTKGSVCYIINENIFCGDTLFRASYGRTDFIDGNFNEIRLSITKLFELQGNYKLLCGHGEPSDLNFEREKNPILGLL